MRTLRARLIVSHILPLLLVLPLVGIALTYLLETQVLLAERSNELERQAMLVASVTASYPQVWSDPQQSRAFVAAIGERLTAHMQLLDNSGVLLASNDADEQHLLGQAQDVPGLSDVLASGQAVRVNPDPQRGTGAQVLVPVTVARRVIGVIRLTDPLGSIYARFPRTRSLIIGVLALGLFLGLGVGWFLAFDLERPLRRATQAVAHMADGQPLAPLPEQGPEEVRMLLRAFNGLTAQLQELEQARQRLLANLVHELGRPLGAMLSAIQALSRGAEDDPGMRHELLAGMEGEVQRTERILADLTHLYDQTLGPLELERQPTGLRDWLARVLSPWRESAQTQGLRWQSDLPQDLPTLDIDADRLAQALGNVVANAIKFTPSGGEVAVSAGTGNGEVWMCVRDSGPGVPPEEQERIFVPHYRGTLGRRFPQGMGLGLAIARDLVVAHGGRITVQSIVGAGSVFTIWLPWDEDEGRAGPDSSSSTNRGG